MGLQKAYIVVATLVFATTSQEAHAVVIQAAVDLGGENSEILQMIFKQLDVLVDNQQNNKIHSQTQTDLASALLQAVPTVTIKGNITDPKRRLTLTFTVQASRTSSSALSDDDDDDDDEDEEDFDWRGSGGVFHPIVGAVEPYVLGFAELIFNGILSTVISNFLEGSSLLGDVRLV